MPFYEHADVRIHYEEAGSGFPLLVVPGGGAHSRVAITSCGSPSRSTTMPWWVFAMASSRGFAPCVAYALAMRRHSHQW